MRRIRAAGLYEPAPGPPSIIAQIKRFCKYPAVFYQSCWSALRTAQSLIN